MNPTRGKRSPECHSTFATTRSGVVPASSLIPEVVIEDDGSLGRATDRASQQKVDPLVEHFVRREPDGVEEATLFQRTHRPRGS